MATRSREPESGGRVNQRLRTRGAIVEAARELIRAGEPPSMGAVARGALVSEATAYRYFPDLASLIREALEGLWPTAEDALGPVSESTDPVERIAYAARDLLSRVLRYQGSTRMMIAATIARSRAAAERPGLRFAWIDRALDPVAEQVVDGTDGIARLKRRLAVVVSPESVFTLIDFYGMSDGDAIEEVVEIARQITAAALA
ncbi:MAG TPA: TetR/AcrR family transcriptional regulator [Solirubrobacteraceae bacterium]